MAAEPKVIPVAPGSELAEIVDQAAEAPVVLERNGRRFRLVREDEDPFADYDPERVLRGFEEAAGLLSGLDVEAFKAEIRAQRGQASKGRPG
jgi:hypothetical protein